MSSTRFSVLILGHGEMGRTMEQLLSGRHALTIWEKDLKDGSENVALEDAAPGKDFVLFMLHANPHHELALRLRDRMAPECICLSVAKGLDEMGRTPAAVLDHVFGQERHCGILCGPMISEEMRAGRPGFADLGIRRAADFHRAGELFAGTGLRLRHSTDMNGVSWSAILKNVYVPLLGAADALELGDNARGTLVASAIEEMDRIVQVMGGKPGTAYGLAGLGDLVTTGTSPGSLHRRIGRELAQGQSVGMGAAGPQVQAEGLHTLAMIRKHSLIDMHAFPLLALVRDIVDDPRDVRGKLNRYLNS